MIETEIIKIFGGPGTGKTTTIVGNTDIDGGYQGILQQLFEQEDPQDLLLLAYTRSAADEAKDRLYELTDVNKGVLDERITTIHSLVMGLNNVWPDKICELRKFRGNNDYRDFCEKQGLKYSNDGDNNDDIMASDDDEGHTFFQINSWLKSNMMNLSEWEECPAATGWPHGDDFVEYGLEWIQYKNRHGVYEFDDVIQISVDKEHTVDADQLFVDETQDLYPLQQEFIENQIGEVDRIWFAADDDQTIYEWSGARPEYVLNKEPYVESLDDELWGDKAGHWDDDGVYILDQSWRMPSEVLDLSKRIISQVSDRQEKGIKPHHDGGEISVYRRPSATQIESHINHDDTFILFRSNFQASDFGKELIDLGIPFTDRFKTWREETVNLREGLAALKNGKSAMAGEEAAQIIRELPDRLLESPADRNAHANAFEVKHEVELEELTEKTRPGIPLNRHEMDTWLTSYEERNYYQQEAVKNNILRDREHLYPEGLTLETIHWSKGKEADTVILSLDTTNTVLANMPMDGMSDAELRLYYVGVTRTKNELVIAESLNSQSPSIPTSDLLGDGWRDEYGYEDWEL